MTSGTPQPWLNNSANPLNVSGNVGNGEASLTYAGTGNATISGALTGSAD